MTASATLIYSFPGLMAQTIEETESGQIEHQWQVPHPNGRRRYTSALGVAGASWAHRYQVRLRYWPLRGLLGSHQWRRAALMLHLGQRREAGGQNRHHRRSIAAWRPSGAKCVVGPRRTTV